MITRCKWNKAHENPRYYFDRAAQLGLPFESPGWLETRHCPSLAMQEIITAYERGEISDGLCPDCARIVRKEAGMKPREETSNADRG